jgi:hypothetical protein
MEYICIFCSRFHDKWVLFCSQFYCNENSLFLNVNVPSLKFYCAEYKTLEMFGNYKEQRRYK